MNHQSPFFILANPRSGSSLLRIICDCNSKLTVPPESGFLLWWKSKYENISTKDLRDPIQIEKLVTDILSSKKIETWQLEKEQLIQYLIYHNPVSYAHVGSLVYYFQALMRKKKPIVWGDKNNYYIHHLYDLIELYPDAKYIHLVRDGRDVACSYRNLTSIVSTSDYFPNLPVDISEIAKEWADNNRRIELFLKTNAKNNFLLVKYEDLVRSMKDTCIKISEFLNVPFDKTMLEYNVLNKKNNLEPSQTVDWKMNTLKKPDTSRIHQYKLQFSAEELDLFNLHAGSALKNYGYV
ncbi:sulfotransferase family protein [Jejudonia soesokkakensis]|uniref:Sulfotransferase family protein n=1 Tax=Jejudonia soesokkakensis TaxID=1323432 RepID=A0ABW2MR92_9FLAO